MNPKLRVFISAITLFSLLLVTMPPTTAQVSAGVNNPSSEKNADEKKATTTVISDERKIIETITDIIEDETCECTNIYPEEPSAGFPKYLLFGLPFGFIAAAVVSSNNDTSQPIRGSVISAMSVN